MTALLEVVDLRKTYRLGKIDVEALRGVNLRITSGELVAIMGPSGCGKSTLMHVLGAMTQPTSGSVFIDGKNIALMNDAERTAIRRRKLGFVFQKFNLLPTLTAAANIRVARHIHGDGLDAEGDAHLHELLTLLMIHEKMDRKPSELSGGEQQRVAIARAVANRPAILLADEPTGSLDSKNSEVVLRMFQELNRKFGQTIVLVTHNPELAAYTTRLVEMRDGQIVADNQKSAGDPSSFVEHGSRKI
jgi:putative ABC transport system ATP-binding protein